VPHGAKEEGLNEKNENERRGARSIYRIYGVWNKPYLERIPCFLLIRTRHRKILRNAG